MQPRRATPMYLVEDMDDARLRYIGLGFVPAPMKMTAAAASAPGKLTSS